MRCRREVNEAILQMLAAKLDGRLARHGFKRNPRSLRYQRTVPGAKQVIFMDFESHPSSDPSADVHIYPWTFIGIPAAYELAVQMVQDPTLLEGSLDKTLTQPIDWAAPKGQRPEWYFTGEEQIMDAGDSIADYIERWVLPFVDEVSSLRGLVWAYETKDDRTFMQESTLLCVAAAYIILGDAQAAKRVLEQRLGSAQLRELYAKAFAFVERSLAHIESAHAG